MTHTNRGRSRNDDLIKDRSQVLRKIHKLEKGNRYLKDALSRANAEERRQNKEEWGLYITANNLLIGNLRRRLAQIDRDLQQQEHKHRKQPNPNDLGQWANTTANRLLDSVEELREITDRR